jgi:hypothetical protein
MGGETAANAILSDLTVHMKYARYLPELGRRETWDEIVDRNKLMHLKRFPELRDRIEAAYRFVYDRKVLPSMRAMQFGGRAIELNPVRGYNCSFVHIDHPAAFGELMFLLLSGCGVGYSVQRRHVAKLPPVQRPHARKTRRYLIGDSIEGWSDAVKVLVEAYFHGKPDPKFDFRDIRPKGAPLKTSGGKAPGAQPLKDTLHNVRKVLDAVEQGDQLTPIQVHDMCCYIADAVLAGGIRRSAMIALFDVDDEDMLTCKFGNWWELNPQRARANNSAVVVRHKVDRATFDSIWARVKGSGAGEPGIAFTNDPDWGLNPCLPADTWVQTLAGPRQIAELVGRPFEALVDGAPHASDGFVQTGVLPVYEISTTRGYTARMTGGHRVKVRRSEGDVWVEARELVAGDQLVLENHRGASWDGDGTEDEGWLVGQVIGDGAFNPERGYSAHCRFWGASSGEMAGLAVARVRALPGSVRSDFGGSTWAGRTTVAAVALEELCAAYLEGGSKELKPEAERTSSAFHEGLLRGWFDADGSVQGSQKKGVSVRLTSVSKRKLQAAQRLLLRLGIASTIYEERATAGLRNLPDGHGGMKAYPCQAIHELVVSRDNLPVFAERVGFEEPAKRAALAAAIAAYVRRPYVERFVTGFRARTLVEAAPVYDCTVADVHEFDANGLAVHNCAEVSLRHAQFCNLGTINAADLVPGMQAEFEARARAAAFVCTLQASYTDFHYLREVWRRTTEREALIGVSMTGIAAGGVLALDVEAASRAVRDENWAAAKLLGINPAARCCVIKPEGTGSNVLSHRSPCSSGVHAYHAAYYRRRFRVGKDEPIYAYLAANHPGLLEDDFFKPQTTAVITIPVKAPDGAVTREEPALALLERVRDLNERWIRPGHLRGSNTNNVSTTVTIKPDEWDGVAEWMWAHRDSYTALSVLPYDDHTYTQAPFEEIDEAEYLRLASQFGAVDLSRVREESDETAFGQEPACAGGACEIELPVAAA